MGWVKGSDRNFEASQTERYRKTISGGLMMMFAVCITKKRKKQKARPKGVNLKVRWRAKVAKCDSVVKRAPTALYWCGNVVIDRRFDQLGKVLVCVHAGTIQHRGRATRSIDHDTHGHRLGQDKAQAGFEGSQEAGALDEEVAIASTPSSVRLVSSLLID